MYLGDKINNTREQGLSSKTKTVNKGVSLSQWLIFVSLLRLVHVFSLTLAVTAFALAHWHFHDHVVRDYSTRNLHLPQPAADREVADWWSGGSASSSATAEEELPSSDAGDTVEAEIIELETGTAPLRSLKFKEFYWLEGTTVEL